MSLFEDINLILFNEWDPLSVGSNLNLLDEYHHVAYKFLKLVADGASRDAMLRLLVDEERAFAASTDDKTRSSVVDHIRVLRRLE